MKANGVSSYFIRLSLFPFSLRDDVERWYPSLLTWSIATWTQMVDNFLRHFYSPSHAAVLRSAIIDFRQKDSELLTKAWERFKRLLRKCPQHVIDGSTEVNFLSEIFNYETKNTLDTACGRSLHMKNTTEAFEVLEQLAKNRNKHSFVRYLGKRVSGVHEVSPSIAWEAKLDAVFSCPGIK